MDWTRTEIEQPPNDEVVETIGPSGKQQDLKRLGNLWFLPDGEMYVYYTPVFWRRKPAKK